MKRLLYYVAMFSFAIFCNVEVNASTSLHALFNNESKTIEFNDGTVYYYDTVQPEKKTTLDKGQYIYDSSTYYIDNNTIPLLNNTGGGEVKASIVCTNAISLQNWNNDKVINSITFSGDNSHYNGTFYLHPAINNIVFTNQNSVIHNINIPTSNNIKRRITIDFPDNFEANSLTIQSNLDINITHNKPNILHFSKVIGNKNSSINFGSNSIIYHKENSSLKNIEIKSEKYEEKEKIQAKLNYIATITNKSNGSVLYKVVTSQLTCSKCNNSLLNIEDYKYNWTDKVGFLNIKQSFTLLQTLINTEILGELNFLAINCTTCGISFTKNDLNISIWPMICFKYFSHILSVDCSVCTKSSTLEYCDNTFENRQFYYNEVKGKFIDNKNPCEQCDVTYAGVKWWNGSAYVDYTGQ